MTVADRILALMRARPNALMTPAEIVVRLDVKHWTAYQTLKRMRARGLVARIGYGAYHLPGAKVTETERPSRKLLWSRLLELEERVTLIESRWANRGPA